MVWMGMLMMMGGTHDFSKQVNVEECTMSGVGFGVTDCVVVVVDAVLSCCFDLLGSCSTS